MWFYCDFYQMPMDDKYLGALNQNSEVYELKYGAFLDSQSLPQEP